MNSFISHLHKPAVVSSENSSILTITLATIVCKISQNQQKAC